MFYATQSKINLNCKLCVCLGFFFKFKKSYLLSKELELEGQIKSWTTVRMYLLVTAIILSSTVKKEITTGKYRIIWPHGCVLANLKKKQNKKTPPPQTKTNKKNTTKSHQLVAVWGITISCQLMGLRVAESEPCNGNPSPTLYFPQDTQGLLMTLVVCFSLWLDLVFVLSISEQLLKNLCCLDMLILPLPSESYLQSWKLSLNIIWDPSC